MRLLLAGTAALLMLTTGCTPQEDTVVSPTPATLSASPSPSADPVDQWGQRACALVEDAIENDTLMDAGVIPDIAGAGAKSANPYVVSKAQFLPDRLELALAARGQDDEFAMSASLLTAAIELQTECIRGHLN
jgi:hypothetical protein